MAQYQSIHSAMCTIEIISSSDTRTNAVNQEKMRRLEVDLKPKRSVGRQVRRENAAPDTSLVKHWRINPFPPL